MTRDARCNAGNHQHAVVHSTCVLEHEPNNVKALYRRGACQATTPRPHTHARTRTNALPRLRPVRHTPRARTGLDRPRLLALTFTPACRLRLSYRSCRLAALPPCRLTA